MNRICLILCIIVSAHVAKGQRSYHDELPQRLFNEAKAFFELKNYPGCMDRLQAFKETSPSDALMEEADYLFVSSLYQQGRSDLVEQLEDYLRRYPATPHANEVCFLLGSAYFAQGEYDKTCEWFAQSELDLLSASDQEEYVFRLAYAQMKRGELNTARAYFTSILQHGSLYTEAATFYLAYINYASGKYTPAMATFTKMSKNPLYREQSLFFMAQIYYLQQAYDRVIALGGELLTTYPNNEHTAEVYRLLANSHYQLGDEQKAVDYFAKYMAREASPLRGDRYLYGVCLYNRGDYSTATENFSAVLNKEDVLSQSAYFYLGQCALKQHDKNSARMAFERAATTSFDKKVQEVALYNYALLIHDTSFSGFGESVSIFEDFLNDFPESIYADKVSDHLVEVYMTTKNYPLALASIDKIHQPGSKLLAAKQNLLLQQGAQFLSDLQVNEAIDCFSQSLNLGKQSPEAFGDSYFWRGEAHYRAGRYAAAAEDYRSFLSYSDDRVSTSILLAYYNLGYCYFKQQEYRLALQAFQQYVHLEKEHDDPIYADAFNRIGDCFFYNRQFAEAETNYSKAALLQPWMADYSVFQKGFVRGLQKNYRGKIEIMDQLIDQFPESEYLDDAMFEKGRTYVLLEDNSAAITCFTSLISSFPDGRLARKSGLQLGLLYFNENQLNRSVQAYKQVIADYPGSEEAVVALQDLKAVYVEMDDVAAYAAYLNDLGTPVRMKASEQDSLTYYASEKLFLRGNLQEAEQSLRRYQQAFPQGAFHTDATYYLAKIAFAEKNYPEALQLFSALVVGEDRRYLEESVARKAEIEYLTKSYNKAFTSFKQLRTIAESNENRVAATVGMMRCAEKTGQSTEAVNAANALLKEKKLLTEQITEARYVRAKAYLDMDQEEKALEDLKHLSRETRTVYGAEAKYLLANNYYEQKQLDEAEKILIDYIKEGTTHQYWLARAFVLLADVYIDKGDHFQARQYLNSLQKNYHGEDDIEEMIEERLEKLN